MKKILLLLLPFWTPMIPPMGIAGIKRFLHPYGYRVKIADANIEEGGRSYYYAYFHELKPHVPTDKRGNFFSIGHDVLRNHMMAHLHYTDETEYRELIRILIAETYYIDADDALISKLEEIVSQFYRWIETYLTSRLEEESPEILGLTVNKDTIPASLFAFQVTRERYPHIKTVMGGPIFSEQLSVGSPDLEFFLEKTRAYIDVIMIGPGEKLLLKYLQGELPDNRRVFTLKDIGAEGVNFSELALADYSDIDTGKYPYLGALASSGCQYVCSFCNVVKFFGKYAQKDVKQAVDEMIKLYRLYGSQLFFMGDNMVNPIASDLAREFKTRETAIYWSAYLKIDEQGCDPEVARLWRQGGFYCARLGTDSGSQRVLDLMDKRITPALSSAMIASLANVGIKTTTYWLIGHPGETEQDFQHTLNFLEENKNNIYEAECEYFNYYYTGQAHSDKWAHQRTPVYPESAGEMLIIRKWGVDGEPSRREIFRRVSRFVQHCEKLGIPNPYSLNEIYLADERWRKLHENAVPPVLEFGNGRCYLDDRQKVKIRVAAPNEIRDDGEFNL
jgi:hypothetical protein